MKRRDIFVVSAANAVLGLASDDYRDSLRNLLLDGVRHRTSSRVEVAEQRTLRAIRALTWITSRPIPERNPDGEDQAAESMQLMARETLAALQPQEPGW